MKTIDLAPGDPRLGTDVFPVLRELRPHLTAGAFEEVYAEGHGQGLRFTAAYGTDGVCAGVAGWRVVVNTSALRKLYIDDLVTTEGARSRGVGRELLGHLERRAGELGCHHLELDSGTARVEAHRFYFRERMHISGYHFTKPVEPARPVEPAQPVEPAAGA